LPGRKIAARRWVLHVGSAVSKLDMEVWTDGARLLRIDIPAQMLSVLRDDISSVSARLVTMARPNDEQISIPANGFSMAGTLSRPVRTEDEPAATARKGAIARLPAVILVSGPSPSDRDEIVAATDLCADRPAPSPMPATVGRYDRRAVGRRGGARSHVRQARHRRARRVRISARRKTSSKRIAMIGYGEAGRISMLVAAREEQLAPSHYRHRHFRHGARPRATAPVVRAAARPAQRNSQPWHNERIWLP
jgi:hypothetical protein